MNATLRAATVAALVVGAASLVLYTGTPAALAAIFYIVVMLPLWAIDNLGVIDIGTEKNGFFLPTPAGYVIGAILAWCCVTLLIRMIWPRVSRHGRGFQGSGP